MHPSAQAVMSGFQAFAQGGTATMRALFADDATWHRCCLERDDDTLDSIVQVSACVLHEFAVSRALGSAVGVSGGPRHEAGVLSCILVWD
jgi:ketosteroid isomerase-like protein